MQGSSLESQSSYWTSYENCEQTLIPCLMLLTQSCFCFPKAFWMWPADDTKYSQLKRLCLKEKVPSWKRPVVILRQSEQQIFLPFPPIPHHCQALWRCLAGSPQSCCWKDSSPPPPCWKFRLRSPCRAEETFSLAGELQWISSRAFSPNKLPNKRASINHVWEKFVLISVSAIPALKNRAFSEILSW